MRTRIVCLCAAVAVLVAGAVSVAPGATSRPPARHVADGLPNEWPASGTGIAGTAGYENGTWTFTDYPYDDKGAGGAFEYPAGAEYGANAADAVLLQVAVGEEAVHYLLRLNTLIEPDTTVVALAVDTDGNDSTAAEPWPYGADISTAGWDHVITAWGTGGTFTPAGGGAPVPIDVAADTDANTIEFDVPRALADPAGGQWRYRGAVGLWDGTGWQEAGDGSATQADAFNLLFRNRIFDGGTTATDETDSPDFQVAKQSSALATGDLQPFVRTVDFGVLASGATQGPSQPTTDMQYTHVYATAGSPNSFPEGIGPSASGVGGSLYNGRYQPYILFVPATYWSGLPSPAPMLPMLHGWRGNHRGFNPSGNAFWTDVVRANRVLVPKPLGRGEEVWYEHLGELDVLEVIADVARRYSVDADRIYLGGTSMGGLGTIKVAEAHPDLFAAIVPSVPPMSDRATGYAHPAGNDWDLVEQADSLRNVPVRNFTGTYDALVPAGNDSRRFCDRLKALVYDHICWRDISEKGTHKGFENDRAADIAAVMRDHPRRVVNPARVTYEIHPVWFKQARDNGLAEELPYDSAYWVSGIIFVPRTPPAPAPVPDPNEYERRLLGTGFGRVDVVSAGLGLGEPATSNVEDDPSPTIIRDGTLLTPTTASRRNALSLSTENVSALTLDLGRASLTLKRTLEGTAATDRAVTLTLAGRPGRACLASFTDDGTPIPTEVTRDQVSLLLPALDEPRSFTVACT